MSERVTGLERIFREYLATGGGTDRRSLAAFLQGTLEGCSTDEHRVLKLLNDLGVLEQMLSLPQDFAFEKALPVWLEDVRRSGYRGEPASVSGVLRIAGRATGTDVRGLLLEHVSRCGGVSDTEELRRGLSAACSGREFLVGALFRAVDSGVLAELQHCSDPAQLPALRDSAVNRLRDSSLSEDLPTWIVESWLLALGHPVSETATAPAASWVSLSFRCVGVIIVSVLLCRQLFWYLWGVDEESRWRSGFENLWLCIISGSLIGGLAGAFMARVLRVHAVTRLLFRILPYLYYLRAIFWASVSAGVAGGLLVAAENFMTVDRISSAAYVCGPAIGVALLYFCGVAAFRYVTYAYLAVFLIYLGHTWLFYEENPRYTPWLTSHMPGGDAFFLAICGSCGISAPCLWALRRYHKWTKQPEHRFLNLRDYERPSKPLLTVSATGLAVFWNGESDYSLRAGDGTGREWRHHKKKINAIAFSPNGKLFASASGDATVCVWSVERSDPTIVLLRHWRSVTSVAWSSCGTRLATGGADQEIFVWDSSSWRPVNHFRRMQDSISGLAFHETRRNEMFACLRSGEVCRLSLSENRVVDQLQLEVGADPRMALLCASTKVVVCGPQSVATLQAADFRQAVQAKYCYDQQRTEASAVIGVGFDEDSQRVLIEGRGWIHSWHYDSDSTRAVLNRLNIQGIYCSSALRQLLGLTQDLTVSRVELAAGKILTEFGCQNFTNQRWFRVLRFFASLEAVLMTQEVQKGSQNQDAGIQKVRQKIPILKTAMLICATIGGYITYEMSLYLPAAELFVLCTLLELYLYPAPNYVYTYQDLTDAWTHGGQVGSYLGGVFGAFVMISAIAISLTGRWGVEVVRVLGERALLVSCRILPLPLVLIPAIIVGIQGGFLRNFLWYIAVFGPAIVLLGWATGVIIAVGKLVSVKIRGDLTNGSNPDLYSKSANRQWFGLLPFYLFATVGFIWCAEMIILDPLSSVTLRIYSHVARGGTATGRGTFPDFHNGVRGQPISAGELWSDFQKDLDYAQSEYLGRSFLIEGVMVQRVPQFLLSAASDGRGIVKCEFDYEDFAHIAENLFPDFVSPEDHRNGTLREGQRILVRGVCLGLQEDGLVHLEKCIIDRSMFLPELWPKGFRVDP